MKAVSEMRLFLFMDHFGKITEMVFVINKNNESHQNNQSIS